jgi:hypothetical protein
VSIWQPYLDFGWALCELRPGSKSPRVDGWQKKGAEFRLAAMGAGLVHAHSGTCALDIDDTMRATPWLANHGVDIADLFNADDRVQLIGNPTNHGKLLYRLATPRRSKKVIETIDDQKRNIIDFRCIGNQDVLPPSIHPDTGAPYAWAYGDPLLGHWSQLPELPAALDAIWAALVTPLAERPDQANLPEAALSVDDLTAWLESQDADMDRESWVQVGMRIHAATNGQGFYIWDNWSRKGEKYNDPKRPADMAAAWRSFKVDGGLGVGPILAEKTAKTDDFPLQEPTEFDPTDDPTDMSVGGITARLLSRLVYVSGQDFYYGIPAATNRIKNLDENLDIALTRPGVKAMFGPHMPRIINPKTGASHQRNPVEVLEQDMPHKTTVRYAGFHPGEGRIYVDTDGRKYLNNYIAEPVKPLAPIGDELQMWNRLINRIADNEYRRWLMQFFAFILRHPGVKVRSAPFLYSKNTGTGKTTLMQTVPRLLYGDRYIRLASNDMLSSRFTDYLADAWFVVLDEMKGDYGKLDRINLANKLKPWITDAKLPIEGKGLKVYQIPNRVQLTATSNHTDTLHVDNEDRRWGICELGGLPMRPEEALDLHVWLLGDRGPGVLKWIMQKVDLVGFDPNERPPETAGKLTMIRNSLGTWESGVIQAAANRVPPFDRDFVTVEAVRDLSLGPNPPKPFQVAEILKAAPINAKQLRTSKARLYCWIDYETWSDMPQSLWHAHLETGARPAGRKWSAEVPLAIRRMAGDDSDPDDNADLLGKVNAERT